MSVWMMYKMSGKSVIIILIIIFNFLFNTGHSEANQRGREGFVRFAGNTAEHSNPSIDRLRNSHGINLLPIGARNSNRKRSTTTEKQTGIVFSSSIGKNEEAQVADWPFFKSFQSVKSNSDRYRDHYEPVIEPKRQQQAGSRLSNEKSSKLLAESEKNMLEYKTSTTTPKPTTTSSPTTTALPTSTPPASESPTTETSGSTIDLYTTTTSSAIMQPDMSTTTTTTTTTSAPTKPAPTMDPLFAQSFHSSLQQAVNRIVKMTTDSMAKSPSTEISNSQANQNNFSLGGAGRTSSLSLNVLLKNFGAHNWTNLDQILLKSSHKDNSKQNNNSLARDDHKIEITGLHKLQAHKSIGEESSKDEPMEDQTAATAECKVEYTAKNVNISLSNEGRSDYTCDYVIHRKNPDDVELKPTKLDISKVCQLQIKSSFFSNYFENEDNKESSNCTETHLVVAGKRFCYLRGDEPSLERKFDFPIERDAFELNMFHKQQKENKEKEIYLEISPLMDDKCPTNLAKRRPGNENGVEYAVSTSAETPPSSTTTTTTTTTKPMNNNNAKPLQDENNQATRESRDKLDGRRQASPTTILTLNNHSPPRRKFVIKFPNEKQLHPINNRFKVSQTFDINSTPNRNHLLNINDLDSIQQNASRNEQSDLCDGFKHVATVGQLSSAEYPSYYPANINCTFVIKRESQAYCSILLHFRDFDLINSQSSESNCLDDYLQIGQTRYCNKYEMIGHKMKLNFQAPLESSLTIRFRSDHSRSGRGFLIKYQQLLCETEGIPTRQIKSLRDEKRHKTFANEPDNRQHTVAPPMEQPDFGLAIKKSSKNATTSEPQLMSTSASNVNEDSSQANLDIPPGRPQIEGIYRDCNQLNSEKSFLLRSPNSPEAYPSNQECLYYIKRNSSQVCYVELTFLKFDLEADSDCRYDYIEINNVRLCGSLRDLAHKTTRIYFFNEPIKVIKFKSDGTESRSGYLISVEQLECESNGAIIRQGKASTTELESPQTPQTEDVSSIVKVTSTNSSRTIEYDSITTSISRPKTEEPPLATLQKHTSSANTSSENVLRSCGEVFYGKEVTIKSPHWPESYAQDDFIGICRYTIVRNTIGKNKICQLELRFVNLRLGVTDCIDVDGYEVLCGFNTRNMVKYYPFDRQPQLTVSFFTGSAKFKRSASLTSSDLLPTRTPLRFMIFAKQHECIDGFLAPTMQIDDTSSFNQTNLLYSKPINSNTAAVPRYVNRSDTREALISRKKLEVVNRAGDALLRYDFSNVIMPLNQAKPMPSSQEKVKPDLVSTKLIDRISLPRNPPPSKSSDECQFNLAQYNGILSSSSILSKLKTQYPGQSECNINIKLLPGFCQLQLTFGEFDLIPRLGSGHCLEFLELDGIKYCDNELKNSTRVLPISDSSARIVNIRYSTTIASNIYGFRSIFKQLECAPGTLENNPVIPKELASTSPNKKTSISSSRSSSTQTEPISLSPNKAEQVDFKEVILRSEFFEMNSFKLSKSSSSYDPNMFIVYRIKKNSPDVCKIRLMFYKFDLEESLGCKRDFLDINNVDRLCGQLGKPEETRRDYMWQVDRDFLISFVSDSNIQREGFLLFGQQLSSNCSEENQTIKAVRPVVEMAPTYDEDVPGDKQQLSKVDYKVIGKTSTEQPSITSIESTSSKPAQSDANCYKLFYEQKFELASPAWPRKYPPNKTCLFLIHKANNDICSINFNILSMILGPNEMNSKKTGCDAGSQDTLEIDGQIFCGFIDKPRTVRVEFGNRQFVSVKFNSVEANGFGFYIEANQNKCQVKYPSGNTEESGSRLERVEPERAGSSLISPKNNPTPIKINEPQQDGCNQLLIDDLSIVESENFPQPYPTNQECIYAVRRSNQSTCAVDIIMNHFVLEDQNAAVGLCENDYLEVDYSRFCGSYPANHRLRFNFFQDEPDKIIKFHSDGYLSKSGFSLTIKQVRDCDAAHPVSFSPSTGTREKDSSNKQADSEEIINYLPDTSFNLTTVTNSSESSGKVDRHRGAFVEHQLGLKNETHLATLCQFVYHKERQYLVSPGYNDHKDTYDNNIDCLYKIVAKSYDFCSLKLTIQDLDLESLSDCHNDYLLIDNKRYCDKAALNESNLVLDIQFADTLPREIHLLFHTNAHVNRGRGFKMLYEQQVCDQIGEQDFRLQNGDMKIEHLSLGSNSGLEERIARRARFGQLTYPKNYVSQPTMEQSNEQQANQQQFRKGRLRQVKDANLSWIENKPYISQVQPKETERNTRHPSEKAEEFTLVRKEIVVVKQKPTDIRVN